MDQNLESAHRATSQTRDSSPRGLLDVDESDTDRSVPLDHDSELTNPVNSSGMESGSEPPSTYNATRPLITSTTLLNQRQTDRENTEVSPEASGTEDEDRVEDGHDHLTEEQETSDNNESEHSDYEDNEQQDTSDDEEQMTNEADVPETIGKETVTGTKTSRKKPAKNVREYWTRQKEESAELTLGGRKRKHVTDSATISGKSVAKSAKINAATSETSEALPSMAPIVADKQASQFAQIKMQMARFTDTRRAATQEKGLKEAVKSFGNKRVEAANGSWRIKPMKTPLKNFQITVTAWMCQREVCFEPAGGILADDMGTGKTLMTLGLISAHRPKDSDKERFGSATLVIVPNPGVADQWRREIRDHCDAEIAARTEVLDGRSDASRDELQRKLIVIATFGEVSRQYPSKEVTDMLHKRHKNNPIAAEEAIESEMGLLFQTSWYRVVLDEAQSIKGRITQCSRATAVLEAKYRWCLTGTPLSNDREEYYPYLRFIKFPYATDRSSFTSRFITDEQHLANFDAMVSWVMIRRHKSDSFLGHALFELPEKTLEEIYVPLSEEEEVLSLSLIKYYQRVRAKLESSEEPKVKAEDDGTSQGTDEKHDAHDSEKDQENTTEDTPPKKTRLPLNTTLASVVSHPFNLERMIRSRFKQDEVSNLKSDLLDGRGLKPVITQITEHPECPFNFLTFAKGIEKLMSFKLPAFGGVFNIDSILEGVLGDTSRRDAICPYCGEAPNNGNLAPGQDCQHIHCQLCLIELLSLPDQPVCRDCGASLKKPGAMPTAGHAKRPKSIAEAVNDTLVKRNSEPARDSHGVRICTQPEKNGFFTVATQSQQGPPPSAKLTTAMVVVLQWQVDHPDDKIIIFTQYLQTAKNLGWMLEKAGIGFLYYNGSTTESKKRKAIAAFKSDADKKIMLVSLRAGGTALNLVVANRVILVDPWWNVEAEKQAYGRIERIGQKKGMYMVKIWTKSAVDQSIEELQAEKKADISHALQDDGHQPTQLDDESLAKLFDHKDAHKPMPGSKLAAKNAAETAANKKKRETVKRAKKVTRKPKLAPRKASKSTKVIKKEA